MSEAVERMAQSLRNLLKSEGADEWCPAPECEICKFYQEAREALKAYEEEAR